MFELFHVRPCRTAVLGTFALSLVLLGAGGASGFWPKQFVQRFSPPKVGYWHGDRTVKRVALTFDDGPDGHFTSQILDVLHASGVSATFFLLGSHVEKNPELVRRIVGEGHAIGNHGFSHRNLESLNRLGIRGELERSALAIERACGVTPDLFRAPYGAADGKVIQEANRLGYSLVQWTFSPKDWSQPSRANIVRRIVRHTRNGSIILLHDGSPDGRGNRSTTVDALPEIITALRQEGFELVTVPQLLNIPAQSRQLARS